MRYVPLAHSRTTPTPLLSMLLELTVYLQEQQVLTVRYLSLDDSGADESGVIAES